MNRPVIAALLSALVFPGAGHLYLKRNGRALLFLLPTALAVAVFIGQAFEQAAAIADQILAGAHADRSGRDRRAPGTGRRLAAGDGGGGRDGGVLAVRHRRRLPAGARRRHAAKISMPASPGRAAAATLAPMRIDPLSDARRRLLLLGAVSLALHLLALVLIAPPAERAGQAAPRIAVTLRDAPPAPARAAPLARARRQQGAPRVSPHPNAAPAPLAADPPPRPEPASPVAGAGWSGLGVQDEEPTQMPGRYSVRASALPPC